MRGEEVGVLTSSTVLVAALVAAQLVATQPVRAQVAGAPGVGSVPAVDSTIANRVEIVRTEHGVPHIFAEDLEAMAEQTTATGTKRFSPDCLGWLKHHGDLSQIEVEAVPEGRVVHANAPVAVIRGPLALTQILETPFLNRMNYPSLIATKAARVADAARGSTVLEFGMRRGPHSGANAGGFAALVGGADFTSNVAVSHAVGLDPKGTHAHSMVQAFLALGFSELEAFRRFA